MKKEVRVFAPATVANVACGFDILGFALEGPGDEIVVRLKDSPGITIVNNTPYKDIPTDPARNTAGIAVDAYLQQIDPQQGIEIIIEKKIKPGSGIGSSSASAAGAVYGVNELLGRPLETESLVELAMQGEKAASGAAHADNVGPALLGGFVLIRRYDPLDVIRLPYPKDLFCTIIHPQIELRTEDARRILKREISLKDATKQWGNIAGLVAGLFMEDYSLIGRSLEDVIIEPIRSILIPGYHEVKRKAMEAGALGCSISGSGPSLFALSNNEETARKAGQSMATVFHAMEIEFEIYVSKISKNGPVIL